ncbi:MAG: 1,6-anhydro-N-acetylmuramyl-L-alanine amidase AmpD [Arenicella sp.]
MTNLPETGLISDGRFLPATFMASPNYDQRPPGNIPEALIIHSISLPPGEYGADYVERFFTNQLDASVHPYFEQIKHLTVSSHFYIKRDGQVIQFVSADDRAWHAGVSEALGRENVNDFSIGIELEGWDEASDGFNDEQYRQLQYLSRALLSHYGIQSSNIFAHSDIAPERKNDPGPYFDWQRYRLGL